MTAPLLAASHLTRRLHGEIPVTLVEEASLTIQAGEFVAITGPSGSGKSSLLYLLGLLDKPDSGEIRIEGEDVTALPEDDRAARRLARLGFVFQFHFLLPEFTALENVMLPMQRLGKLSAKEMEKRARALLAQLGLADQAHKLPKQLSGGQSQRVSMARALANDPVLILADEPTGNLDTVSSKNVREILHGLADKGRAVVVVTHDPEFAKTADRIIHIVDGRIQAA
jgi:lipoprotein-releasing system ATP-binding protein